MITLEEFKRLCATENAENIVENVLLADDAAHVSKDNRLYLISRLSSAFSVDETCVKLWITGSAKLGFSTIEKRVRGQVLPRYRSFNALSDIDVAIVSPDIFRIIWDELSRYAHGHAWMPWNSGKLGDYMVYGWLRPDHFPRGWRMQKCDEWWDQFYKFSSENRFNRRPVRGALFHSIGDLRRYLQRSVSECIHLERS